MDEAGSKGERAKLVGGAPAGTEEGGHREIVGLGIRYGIGLGGDSRSGNG